MTPDDLAAFAFGIADAAMIERVEELAVKSDDVGMLWGFAGRHGKPASCLAEASPELREAVAYLAARGLCEVVPEPDGECILMTNDDEPPRPY